MLGINFEKPWLNFRAMVKQISKNPARRRKIQAIDMRGHLLRMSSKIG